MSEAMFYQAIGNSIQANKDKIEKLEKQNTRLKKQKKVLQQENKQLKEELQQENNYFIQGGRSSGKTYITKLEQQLNLYKDVIEEVRKLIPKQLLSNVNITKYTDEMCLRDILQILDKAKENK